MTQPSALQLQFVADLQKQIGLRNDPLDVHCVRRFGVPFAQLDRRQCSELIDELKGWKAVPADLQRAMGQHDLFEVGM